MKKKDEKDTPIKLTLDRLLQSRQSLVNLFALPTLSGKTNFMLSKTMRAANSEFTSYDEAFKALCERFGKSVPNQNGAYQIEPEKHDQFTAEHATLVSTTVSLPGFKVSVDELDKASRERSPRRCRACGAEGVATTVGLSAQDMAQLDWLIEEPK